MADQIRSVDYASSTPASAADTFNALAAKYEKNTGGATRVVAKHLINLASPIPPHAKILDNPCGTGIVVDELLASISSADQPGAAVKEIIAITCVDAASSMVELLKGKATTVRKPTLSDSEKQVDARVLAAEELDALPSDYYTHSFTNFGFQFFKDPYKAAKDIYRRLKHGRGEAFITSWKDIGYMRAVDAAQEVIRPGKEKSTLPFDYAWFKGEHVMGVFEKAGFGKAGVDLHEREGE